MLSERGLLSALKAAWKRSDGYELVENGGNIGICAGQWTVVCESQLLPRKVLALIVEHLGSIPRNEAWRLGKGFGAQKILHNVTWEIITETVKPSADEPIGRTSLEFNGARLWQGTETQRVVAMDQDLTEILSIGQPGEPMRQEDGILWVDRGVTVFIEGLPFDGADREYLEKRKWIGGDRK